MRPGGVKSIAATTGLTPTEAKKAIAILEGAKVLTRMKLSGLKGHPRLVINWARMPVRAIAQLERAAVLGVDGEPPRNIGKRKKARKKPA